ncbi:MAG: hypothetical protein AAB851_00720 [Patescibacteria group bacterium]
MDKKKEQKLDEMIDKMEAEMDKELKELQIKLKTPECHYLKPKGILGKEYMLETGGLDDCLRCEDSGQCWSHGQLKDLIEEERKTLLNQDY